MSITKVLAPNPGPYTGPGTNSYVVADNGYAVVLDPGPIIDTHLGAIEHAVGDNDVAAVIVTHTHPDHAPAANPLGRRFSVPVLGYAPGPEFDPTDLVGDGDRVAVGERDLVAIHTPGHTVDSLCFRYGDVLFTGDHIMGGSTVIIEDAAAYMASLERVSALGRLAIRPGHGDDIEDGKTLVDAYIAHRRQREKQIVAAVAAGAEDVADVVDVVYAGLDPALVPAAQHQVRVQLVKLVDEGRIVEADHRLTVGGAP